MGLLVEDLLLLARLDQQRPLAQQPVDLLTLAADAVHDARLLAPSRTIDLSVQPGAAFLVIGDEPRLRQIIGNLMSNALSHTPDGTPIEVLISSGTLDPREEDPTPAVILDVTDHGPGMTPEQAHRAFERFYRADQARTRNAGGQRARPGDRGRAGRRPRRRRVGAHRPWPGRDVPDRPSARSRGAGRASTRPTRRTRPGG